MVVPIVLFQTAGLNMFKLEMPGYLMLLALLPVCYLLYAGYQNRRARNWKRLGVPVTLRKSLFRPDDPVAKKLAMLLGVLFLCILAMTNPQYGKKTEKVKSRNIDVFLALDVSQSMLCSDIKPDRLSRAQIWIKQFLDRFPSERIGFISFAGSSYLHAPLTTDIATIRLMSAMAGPRNIGTQGTVLADAIKMARKSFSKEQGYHKVILLITDGEDHEGGALEAAREAYQDGISLFTVPVGTEPGGPIPMEPGSGNAFKTDREGKLILTKPNRDMLRQLAEAGHGEMLEMQSGDSGFELLRKKFDALSKKEVAYQSFSSYQSYFQYFLALAFLLLLCETLWLRKK
jgi:Ca-activated chloride channel homolog